MEEAAKIISPADCKKVNPRRRERRDAMIEAFLSQPLPPREARPFKGPVHPKGGKKRRWFQK